MNALETSRVAKRLGTENVSEAFSLWYTSPVTPILENLMHEPVCLNCGKSEQQVPLLSLTFKGDTKYICAQCLPIMIHKIHLLADKLPGVEIHESAPH